MEYIGSLNANPFYESRLYTGSIRSVGDRKGDTITKEELIKKIGEFQELYSHKKDKSPIPVRVSDTTFVSETTYSEDGWEVAAISYPRNRDTISIDVDIFMKKMAKFLLSRLDQQRVCVMDSAQIVMYENNEIKNK